MRQASSQKARLGRLGGSLPVPSRTARTLDRFHVPTQADTLAATVNTFCVRAAAPFLPSTLRVAL